MRQDVHYANVDFEVESSEDLNDLIDYFGKQVNVQFHGRLESGQDFVSMSLKDIESGVYGDPERAISRFCGIVENMSEDIRQKWNKCSEIRFDIGFESGDSDKKVNFRISNNTLTRIEAVGAALVITVYPIYPQE